MHHQNRIVGLYQLSKADLHVFAHIFDSHPDKIKTVPIDTAEINRPSPPCGVIIARLLPGQTLTTDIPLITLRDNPVRIGDLLDQIEAVLLYHPDISRVVYRGYRLDWTNSTLFIDNRPVDLTDRERDICYALLAAKDTGCSRRQLLNDVWGYRTDLETHTLETHIYRLRQKIEPNPVSPARLVTTDNGYVLK